MSQSLPVLYSFRRCPYAMRARLALFVSGQPCQLREVVLRNKPQALLDASPKATVPVLVLPDGVVIDESLDIMLWALQRHDPEQWLAPEAGTVEDMLALIRENDGPFKANLDRYKYPNRYDLESGDLHRDQALEWLCGLDERLAQTEWLFGATPALADRAIAPFVRQFANTDRDWFDKQDWPNLKKWLERFLSGSLFASIMNKYPAWEPGQDVTVFGQQA